MMRNAKMLLPFFIAISLLTPALAQNKPAHAVPGRPKLVVGIVVDQMRWDFLYRFSDRYSAGGFKRLLKEGFSCENTMINYLPSETAVGHATIFTGSVPAIHGITGNNWTDMPTGKTVYCTGDSTVTPLGTTANEGKMSPRNLLVTTITDELRMATNFKSKVVGVSIKDRASILPAGHMANAAFWFDNLTGGFVTSNYYMDRLPEWVQQFNSKKYPQQLLANGWKTLYPVNTYTQSTVDDVAWEGRFKGETASAFPHNPAPNSAMRNNFLRQSPYGNTLTLKFAEEAIKEYQLGHGEATDFLTINCASTDYVGHMFGPNSIEIEDTYLRLDKDLSDFFTYLDNTVGKANYLIFLTADHGAGNSIGFLKKHGAHAGPLNSPDWLPTLNAWLQAKFRQENLVTAISGNYIILNDSLINRLSLDAEKITAATSSFLKQQTGILTVANLESPAGMLVPEPIRTMLINGYYAKRSYPLVIVPESGRTYAKTGAGHGSWYTYDTHIPLIFMGAGIQHGSTGRTVYMTDISATVAALLHIQVPGGCIGHPITEVMTTKIFTQK